MTARRFRADIDIHVSPRIGWQVLTDFTAFEVWNPLLRRVIGKPKAGSLLRLHVVRQLGSDETVAMPARVRVCREEVEIAWGGGVRGLLDVHHYFRLVKTATGVRLEHGEDFTGVLVPLLWPILGKRVRHENYVALNEAFRRRCEEVKAGLSTRA